MSKVIYCEADLQAFHHPCKCNLIIAKIMSFSINIKLQTLLNSDKYSTINGPLQQEGALSKYNMTTTFQNERWNDSPLS